VGVGPSGRGGSDVCVNAGMGVSVFVAVCVGEGLDVEVNVDEAVAVKEGDGVLRRVGLEVTTGLGGFVRFATFDGVGKTSLARGDGNGEAVGAAGSGLHALKDRPKKNITMPVHILCTEDTSTRYPDCTA
jgi:hypothetical protein